MRQGLMLLLICLMLVSVSGMPIKASEDVPDPMPLANEQGSDIVIFLLLGSDTTNPANSGRTDVILLVLVNRTASTVSFFSIPRDFYAYIPGYGLHRINTAYGQGERLFGEGGGAQLLKETILYNLGIEVDYYARVDFNDFKTIIDAVGGIDMAVDCAIQDWRLREPGLDITIEESWEMFTLPVGYHHMDGDLALWYVRSRRTSSDFDRGRRQQDMMRALWRQINQLGLVQQLPDIWQQVTEMAETDLTLPDLLGLTPMVSNLESSHMASFTLALNEEVTAGFSPEGSSILIPVRDQLISFVDNLMIPPTENRIVRESVTVEIVNASGITGLAWVAADRLAWEGFITIVSGATAPYREYTAIHDYTGQTKGSSVGVLQSILRVSGEGVTREPDAQRRYDYQVVIGNSYYACTYDVLPPKNIPSPES